MDEETMTVGKILGRVRGLLRTYTSYLTISKAHPTRPIPPGVPLRVHRGQRSCVKRVAQDFHL